MKKVVRLIIETIFLLGALYALGVFTHVVETINLSIPV